MNKPIDKILEDLQERAKELNCLYKIEELLNNPDASLNEIFHGIIDAIPPGWQYPDICKARISFSDKVYKSAGFKETPWVQSTETIVHEKPIATIEVFYIEKMPQADEGPFLKEERKLINTISDRLGHFIMHQQLRSAYQEWQSAKEELLKKSKADWWIILEMLHRTDQNLLQHISRKMLNYLCWIGIPEAEQLLRRIGTEQQNDTTELLIEQNRPLQRENLHNLLQYHEDTFRIAESNLSSDEILSLIQKWIKDDKSSFLFNVLENLDASLLEIADAVDRYFHIADGGIEFSPDTEAGLRVSLIRRFLTDQLKFINIAKDYFEIRDFYNLIQHIIFPERSHGKLGGKSSGLLLAGQIIKKNHGNNEYLKKIKIPKTWYINSDAVSKFIHYNNLEDLLNQKYKEIDQIRQEYPHIVQIFKNSYFSPDIVKSLSMMLDELGGKPLIVRSSSLLEDRIGAAFFGKYKSLFLANQGTKKERLNALLDAVAEVYASVFSPDAIQYRIERGLLDFHEEMGIMIQEVIGKKVGKYFLPAYAGVAFSNNEFRWSPRIKREDSLIRLVPGLGTRAVDRLSDDYPVLIAPGQPGLRANVTNEEVARYSPKMADVINLETNEFESIYLSDLFKEHGEEYPVIHQLVSIHEDSHIRKPLGMEIDFEKHDLIITFDGLVKDTAFVHQIKAILKLLQEKLGMPVDIEFVSDGADFYLLQCRPQSYSRETIPAPIPRDIAHDKIIFSAGRYISNGYIPDITHIVYIDPVKYNQLATKADYNAVGRAVSKLNKLLPKRQFVLMGPGRWGSRGDIKLGVNVTYSDINNTAALIEIARKKGNYLPDLSFGTHFFQDLVESSIRYLPLYPDDDGIIFNEDFLLQAKNILAKMLPEYSNLAETVRVIDVPENTNGQTLRILMNANLGEALGILDAPETTAYRAQFSQELNKPQSESHWRWRLLMAEKLACKLDGDYFGVKACYLFGSTKNATAGPASDIDLLIHFAGTEAQKKELCQWLNGWSRCLEEMNYLRTGYKSDGLLDVHFVTDEDIKNKTSYAIKIGAVTDAARPLAMKAK